MAERDVFVSHAGRDRAWAEWVAWQLSSAGYSVELDAWDWPAGASFVARMREALEKASRMVALWSPAYFETHRFTNPEWEAVFAARDGSAPRLIPVKIAAVQPPLLLRPLIAYGLYDLDAASARRVLLEAVGGPVRPDREPLFPPTSPTPPAPGGPRLPGVLPGVWNVPTRSAAFTGRDGMLVELRERLAGSGAAVVQALHGMGGVGKTSLAIEYAHRFASAYDLVWWVDAERQELIGEQVAALGAALRLVDAQAAVPVAVVEVKRHLRGNGGWLVVFDNATTAEELQPSVPSGPGHVLITSRKSGLGSACRVAERGRVLPGGVGGAAPRSGPGASGG